MHILLLQSTISDVQVLYCPSRNLGSKESGVHIEKDPYKLIKITSDETTPLPFTLWIQIKGVGENDSRIKITVDVNVNPLMSAMVKNPLKSFVDTLVDQAEKIEY